MIQKFLTPVVFLFLSACTSLPDGVEPVSNFELQRYTGKWYEIARIENRFEKGLEKVTATYELQDDGSVLVVNRGFDVKNQAWKEAKGRAVFVGDSDIGHLQVSFFGPFYSSYVIFDLDTTAYSSAYVAGYNKEYLWFLSRKFNVSETEIARFKQTAQKLGFDLSTLVYPRH
ncbi:lipoprotein Blc [Pseudoalteromonas luteoviolacea B = ATCC 29581]|nr:lipoprotein Blc [Pseudoalteromonas luteoviolacea B = ATCC 29581]